MPKHYTNPVEFWLDRRHDDRVMVADKLLNFLWKGKIPEERRLHHEVELGGPVLQFRARLQQLQVGDEVVRVQFKVDLLAVRALVVQAQVDDAEKILMQRGVFRNSFQKKRHVVHDLGSHAGLQMFGFQRLQLVGAEGGLVLGVEAEEHPWCRIHVERVFDLDRVEIGLLEVNLGLVLERVEKVRNDDLVRVEVFVVNLIQLPGEQRLNFELALDLVGKVNSIGDDDAVVKGEAEDVFERIQLDSSRTLVVDVVIHLLQKTFAVLLSVSAHHLVDVKVQCEVRGGVFHHQKGSVVLLIHIVETDF